MSDTPRTLAAEARPFTYADYKAWELDEGKRFELIEGVPYAMAAPSDFHQGILVELVLQIGGFVRGTPCRLRPAPYDVRLFYEEDESDDTVVQPDLSVICDEAKRGPEGGRGAPDLVVEIRSPSHTAEAYTRKFNLYRRAGVREYWLLDPKSKTLRAYALHDTDPAASSRVYDASSVLPSAALPGLSVSLEEVFSPLV